MKEIVKYILILVFNLIIISIFAQVAIYFGKWWIILFGICGMFTFRSTRDDEEE